MGKHNKVCRKNYWKRRESRLKGRGNQVECSSVSDKVEQTHFGFESDTVNHSDNNNKDQTDHVLRTVSTLQIMTVRSRIMMA